MKVKICKTTFYVSQLGNLELPKSQQYVKIKKLVLKSPQIVCLHHLDDSSVRKGKDMMNNWTHSLR